MTTPTHTPSPQQAARRKLVRGVFAAPAVLTLSSGASATVKSNMRCVNNQVNNGALLPKSYTHPASVPTGVIRVQVWEKSGKHYFKGSDVVGFAHPHRPVTWINSGQWHEFDWGTQMKTGSPVGEPVGCTHNGKYANVLMDQHGYIVGVGKHTAGNSMQMATCWNSFRAGPI